MLYSTCGLLVHKTQKSTYVQKLRTNLWLLGVATKIYLMMNFFLKKRHFERQTTISQGENLGILNQTGSEYFLNVK